MTEFETRAIQALDRIATSSEITEAHVRFIRKAVEARTKLSPNDGLGEIAARLGDRLANTLP